jgi:hypothetical protein
MAGHASELWMLLQEWFKNRKSKVSHASLSLGNLRIEQPEFEVESEFREALCQKNKLFRNAMKRLNIIKMGSGRIKHGLSGRKRAL